MKFGMYAAFAAGLALTFLAPQADAGDCTGYVVGVRTISQYDHASGRGFLAIRSGPGSGYAQIGEIYLDDEYWVAERSGNWAYIGCMKGYCEAPLWGPAYPEGWAYAKYLDYGGACD